MTSLWRGFKYNTVTLRITFKHEGGQVQRNLFKIELCCYYLKLVSYLDYEVRIGVTEVLAKCNVMVGL